MQILLKYTFFAVVVYFIASYFHVGYVHADEYYQIFQFAAFKIGFNVLRTPWEYTSGMRATLLPTVVVIVYHCYKLIFGTVNPFTLAFIMRIIASTLSISAIFIMLKIFLPTIKSKKNRHWFILLSLFTVGSMYFNIHYCAETISGGLFLIAFCLVWRRASVVDNRIYDYIIAGLCLGLAFTARFQLGFCIAGLLLWLFFIRKIPQRYLWLLLAVLLLTLLFFNIMLDHWFYGRWVISSWNYFKQNILLDKVNGYGREPWYYYIIVASTILPFGALYVAGCIILFYNKPKHILTWTLLPFIVVHSIIGHKEIRFMVPIVNFMPLCFIYALEIIEAIYINSFKVNKILRILWLINCVFILILLIPPTTELPMWYYIYEHYPKKTDYYFLTYGGSDVDFYKRQSLYSHKITYINEAKCDATKVCLLGLTCEQAKIAATEVAKYSLIYSQCPSWLFRFNITNWIGRTAIYNLYLLN